MMNFFAYHEIEKQPFEEEALMAIAPEIINCALPVRVFFGQKLKIARGMKTYPTYAEFNKKEYKYLREFQDRALEYAKTEI